MNYKALNKIVDNIKKSQKILLFTHQNPDYDAYGATAALHTLFLYWGKDSTVIYFLNQPKLIPRIKNNVIIYSDKKTVDLSEYDYAICLDTNFSPNSILGLNFIGNSRLGVGTIDHHARLEFSNFADQDFNLPSSSSTCEIIYNIIDQHLESFSSLPYFLRVRIALYLLQGILDDMVGLTIIEKTNEHNLAVLQQLKKIVGPDKYHKKLTQSRTLRLPADIAKYSSYLKHYLLVDKDKQEFHGYLLSIPEEKSQVFKKVYSQALLLYDHYARMSCEKVSNNYGIFVLVIAGFDLDIIKVSARGPLVKQLLSPIIKDQSIFLTCGISGNSAFGGRVNNQDFNRWGENFIKKLKEQASNTNLYSAEADDEYLLKKLTLQELNQ